MPAVDIGMEMPEVMYRGRCRRFYIRSIDITKFVATVVC